jgi:DNA-binding GntR family transcriptional regulator
MGARVRDEIVQDLKNEIARGTFVPGQRIVESALCERYQAGRTTVREVLRRLEQDGFVRIAQNAGATVTDVSQGDIEHIYDLMGVLEGLSVRTAAPFIAEMQTDQIESTLTRMESTTDPFEFFEHNFEFHSILMSLSENSRLIKFMGNLRAQAQRMSLRSFFNPGQIAASISEHRRILEAIRARNAIKAENLVRHHYLLSKNRLIKYLNRSL